MADTYAIYHVSLQVGAAELRNFPIFTNISENGAISILDTNIWSNDGTATVTLVYCDATGATVEGTIATYGTALNVFAAAGTALLSTAGVITAPVVPPGKTVSIEIATAGTTGADTVVQVGYIKGHPA